MARVNNQYNNKHPGDTQNKGLAVTEIKFSNLERTLRLDSEFYSKDNLTTLDVLKNKDILSITDVASVSDGNHMKISEHFSEDGQGVPYYRGQDIYSFFIEQSTKALKITKNAFEFPYLKRSHLQKGDVLLSIVGAIIGNLSLVKTDQEATCSCKLAILRPHSVNSEFLAVFLQCKYGQNQIQKFRRGTAQTGLILEDFDQIKLPVLTRKFQNLISKCVNVAFENIKKANETYYNAEDYLLKEVNMHDFDEPTNTINIKTLSNSFQSSGRLDAEYYQPKYEKIIEHLEMINHTKLKNIVSIKKSIEPGSDKYDEIAGIPFLRVSDFDKYKLYTPDKNLSHEFYEDNKVLINSLMPKKDTILFSKDGSVGIAHLLMKDESLVTSSAILHLTLKNKDLVLPEYLTLVLNSKLVQMQAERDAGGSIIKHWRQTEIEEILIPLLDIEKQFQIATLVKASFEYKNQSEKILIETKKAVEIAIETDETNAIDFINNHILT